MVKRRTILCVVMAGILLAGAVPAFANGSVVVWPALGGDHTASVGDTLELQTAWIAATQGQVRVYLNHTAERLTLLDPHGEVVWELSAAEWATHWGPLERFEDDWFLLDCPMPTLWSVWWSYTVPGVLTEVGTYELVYTGTFEQPVNDGLHACIDLAPPGEYPPILTPSLYRGTVIEVSTIQVE